MTNLGTTYSTNRPQAIEITEKKIYVASNIEECQIEQDFDTTVTGYKFTLTEYNKDEYIILMATKTNELADELEAAKIILGVE